MTRGRAWQVHATIVGGARGETVYYAAVEAATIHEAITKALVEAERCFDGGGRMVAFSVEEIGDAGASEKERR